MLAINTMIYNIFTIVSATIHYIYICKQHGYDGNTQSYLYSNDVQY